jgi:hypothetical protein
VQLKGGNAGTRVGTNASDRDSSLNCSLSTIDAEDIVLLRASLRCANTVKSSQLGHSILQRRSYILASSALLGEKYWSAGTV